MDPPNPIIAHYFDVGHDKQYIFKYYVKYGNTESFCNIHHGNKCLGNVTKVKDDYKIQTYVADIWLGVIYQAIEFIKDPEGWKAIYSIHNS
jgi:hypothetical protein